MIRARLASSALTFLPLVACTGGERANNGQCPAGEVCSPATPKGLSFVGVDLVDLPFSTLLGPQPTAIGGTQPIQLVDLSVTGAPPLALPFTADPGTGGILAIASTAAGTVTLRGVAAGTDYLRILDPADHTLYDRKLLSAAKINLIHLLALHDSLPPTQAIAVLAGDVDLGIAVWGTHTDSTGLVQSRVVDTGMQVSLPVGASRPAWDSLHLTGLVAGTTAPIQVTAGDHAPVALDVPVLAPTAVDHLELLPPDSVVHVGDILYGCFLAIAVDKAVVGLPWTFTVNGATATAVNNCVSVPTTQAGPVTIVATAATHQVTAQITVVAPFAPTPPPTPTAAAHDRGTTLGDRALLAD